ncbi:MAG: AAA family ATPase [Actinobacteria bacterium]|jgi:DNA-binding transcriptional ArsR family regulator/5S rRNA maturation endonuclease (ribonuclease M5)|nr:AAA family ATPase [Actinomycetota bacterium]
MSHESDPIQRVLDRLEGGKRNGHGYLARCPAHDDHNPSLSVTEGDGGRVLLKCHAGCELKAIVKAIELDTRDLFPEDAKTERKISETYDYTDEEGELLFQVVRFHPKDFRQRRRSDDGEWEWKLGDTRRVLYRLPEVLTAVADRGEVYVVYVVEGEKDVHALEAAGCVATCNPGGAGKWRREYAGCLAGAKVIVVADKDEPGRKHAAEVAASLQGKAVSVTVVEAKAGKDAADHLAAGHGLDEFVPVDLHNPEPAPAQESCSAFDPWDSLAPTVAVAPGSYTITWSFPDARIDFEADRLKSHSDGRTQAQVVITATLPGGTVEPLNHEMMNLAAGQTRRSLSQALEKRFPRKSIKWDTVIEESCRLILVHEQEGSPTVRLQPVDSVGVRYILGNMVLEGLPVLSYAPGGTFKSFLSLYKALLIENGLPFLGADTPQANTIILDWEVSEAEAARRCVMLANGLRRTNVDRDIRLPLYRRCTGPMTDEVSEIAKVIAKNDVRFVVIDSAGLACGGDVASAELTIQFFNVLRKVTAFTGAAADIQTHTTKADRREENHQRLPIGSIYWENLSRITWELRSEQERKGVYRLGLFPRKCNMGQLEPVGLRMTFDEDALVVESTTVNDVTTEQGAVRAMILAELENGACGPSELAEAIGTTPSVVSKTLTDMKNRGLVENVGRGKWTRTGNPRGNDDESYPGKNQESYR